LPLSAADDDEDGAEAEVAEAALAPAAVTAADTARGAGEAATEVSSGVAT
jgi:hypothetical protein